MIILVSGHNKARALHHAIDELKVGTVRYFRDIESRNFDNGL